MPRVRPDDDCGTDNGGPTTSRWVEGPHARFDELGPATLAPDSLAWFEESPETVAWRENPTARLALVYPSHGLEITARNVPSAGLSWEEQLRTWFQRFAPGGDGLSEVGIEQHHWTIEFGHRGSVRGHASSDSAATEAMKSVLRSPLFHQPTFSLGLSVRRSSHVMDCYGVETDDVEELDELPLRLREKRARYGSN